MSIPPHLLVAWIGLSGAAPTDLASGKIPNWLTGSMMAAGIGTHVIVGASPWAGVLGLLAAFALHFTLWVLQVNKAGDAKLMMGVGACLGVYGMLETSAWWAILNLPVGLAILALRGRLGNFVAVLRQKIGPSLGWAPPQLAEGEEAPVLTMSIAGPLIAVSGILAMHTDWLEQLV